MALTKEKKQQVINEAKQLLAESRLTVLAQYGGTSVKDLQNLRRSAGQNGTVIRIIKNRLFKKAVADLDQFKSVDISQLQGQLLYAFNGEDEVAPAQSLAKFSAAVSPLTFVGALASDGQFMPADDVKLLATLPTKQQLRGQLASVLVAPSQRFVNVVSGNLASVLNALQARTEQLNS